MAAERRVEVNGIHLAVKEDGKGRSMILIHGKGYSKENMNRFFDHYRDHFHVVSYDVRGHGESDKPASFTLEDDVKDLAALTEVLHLQKPVVIGFSMGSYITLRTAEEYTDLFSKIVLIGTKGRGSVSSTEQIQRDALRKGMSPHEAAQQIMNKIFAPQTTKKEIEAFDREIQSSVRLTAEERQTIDKSLQNFDLLKEAYRVAIPALVLTGEYDGINPPEKGREVAEALPHAVFEVIPDAGHIAFFENPSRVFSLIDSFTAEKE